MGQRALVVQDSTVGRRLQSSVPKTIGGRAQLHAYAVVDNPRCASPAGHRKHRLEYALASPSYIRISWRSSEPPAESDSDRARPAWRGSGGGFWDPQSFHRDCHAVMTTPLTWPAVQLLRSRTRALRCRRLLLTCQLLQEIGLRNSDTLPTNGWYFY
jgi:hypothetical protein